MAIDSSSHDDPVSQLGQLDPGDRLHTALGGGPSLRILALTASPYSQLHETHLRESIKKHDPDLIVALGAKAVSQHDEAIERFTRRRGDCLAVVSPTDIASQSRARGLGCVIIDNRSGTSGDVRWVGYAPVPDAQRDSTIILERPLACAQVVFSLCPPRDDHNASAASAALHRALGPDKPLVLHPAADGPCQDLPAYCVPVDGYCLVDVAHDGAWHLVADND